MGSAAAAMGWRAGGGDVRDMRLENLRMYRVVELLAAEIDRLLPQIRRCAPHLADHVLRSTEAALFNIAEGAGSFKAGIKTSSYDIARKELNEIRAVLRRILARRCLRAADVTRADEYAGIGIAMLTNAIRSLTRNATSESRRPPEPPPPPTPDPT
jgi:four helix bundle protein